MIAKLGAVFPVGFLVGVAVCWTRLRCLQAKVTVLEPCFGERMKQQWKEAARAARELGVDRQPKVA
jgi:hypothetical protein